MAQAVSISILILTLFVVSQVYRVSIVVVAARLRIGAVGQRAEVQDVIASFPFVMVSFPFEGTPRDPVPFLKITPVEMDPVSLSLTHRQHLWGPVFLKTRP